MIYLGRFTTIEYLLIHPQLVGYNEKQKKQKLVGGFFGDLFQTFLLGNEGEEGEGPNKMNGMWNAKKGHWGDSLQWVLGGSSSVSRL